MLHYMSNHILKERMEYYISTRSDLLRLYNSLQEEEEEEKRKEPPGKRAVCNLQLTLDFQEGVERVALHSS